VACLYRVVKIRAHTAARGARRRREREARAMADRFAASQQPAAFDRADTMAAIEALEGLAETDREIIVMRIWGCLTYDEIAVALAISTSSAHRQYERALKNLRQILESPCSANANQSELN
jgi:RNA polymerase sigma factor (sigma-70 family)